MSAPPTNCSAKMAIAGDSSFPCKALTDLTNISCPENFSFCEEFEHVPAVYLSNSIVSFLCCCLVFLTYILIKRLWGYSSRVFLLRYAYISSTLFSYFCTSSIPHIPRTSLDFLISICHIILFGAETNKNACLVFGLIFQFSLIAANLWYALLAYDLIRAIRNPFG